MMGVLLAASIVLSACGGNGGNTKEPEIGGATGVGVRILDSQSGEVTLGTPVVITFNNTNSYQELNFKARMESPSKDATPGNVYAQADYKIAYE